MAAYTQFSVSPRSALSFVTREPAFTPDQKSLHNSYMLLIDRGAAFVRRLMIWDIQAAIDLGADKLVDDLHVVLHRFLMEHGGTAPRPETLRGITPVCDA